MAGNVTGNPFSVRATDGLIRQNVVLMSGLVTGAVIAGAKDFESAVTITIVFTAVTFIAICIGRLIPRRIVYTLRIIAYALIAAICFIPARMLAVALMGADAVQDVGVYLVITIINSIILSKTETRFYREHFLPMIPDVLGYIAGFDAVCLFVGMLRDVLVNSRIGWLPFNVGFTVPALSTTFGGFLLVGFLAGLFRAIYNFTRRRRSAGNELSVLPQNKEI
jgi:electron transport complex protein RnfE